MPHDIYFNELAERFERKIYGSKKGDLRLQLLWEDMLTALPELQAEKNCVYWMLAEVWGR